MKARTYMLDGRPIPVTISDAAIEEWLTVRAANRKAGYLDRPQDIDTPSVRAWRRHPGDPGYGREPDFDIGFEVLTSSVPGQPGRRLVAGKRDDSPNKTFGTVGYEQSDGGFSVQTAFELDDQEWRELKAKFRTSVEAAGGKIGYMGPQDFHEIAALGAEVDAAIADWYRERAGVDDRPTGV